MDFTISGALDRIDFSPVSRAAEIVQNVKTLLSTRRGSVPLDRSLGVDMRAVDAPMQRAAAAFRVEIVEALRRFEPRCKVLRVDLEGDAADGLLVPKVQVRIDE